MKLGIKSRLPFKLAKVAGLLLLLESGIAWSDILPGAAMPETVQRTLTEQQPEAVPTAAPAVLAEKEKQKTPLGEAAKKIKFQLNGIVLEGNLVYTQQQLEPIYKDKLHKEVSVAELFDIVQNITNYYRNNGYIISRAILPPQHVKNGIVKIQIIEGFIDNVSVGGNPRGAKCMVLYYGRRIRSCPPLQISRMENYLLLANELPGTDVKAVLSPSKTKTGAADLTLMTENSLITGYMSYDNYGTRYIGPQQMTANIGFNSFLSTGDGANITYTKTPRGAELTYLDLNYSTPVSHEGTRLLFGGTGTHTRPLYVLAPSKIEGFTDNYYTNVTFPMIRSRTQSLTLRGGFNYLDSNVTTFGFQLYTDHIRSLDAGLTYNFTDRFYGANLISTDLRQGVPLFGYTTDTNPDTATTSRPGGRADYTKIILQVSRLQAIKGPVSMYGVFSGQWAFNPLLASEQFTFGGSQLGRGYDVAELIGDKGAGGSLELRYDWAVSKFYIQNLQLYAYYDVGAIWNLKTSFGTPEKASGASAGLGARFYMNRYVTGNIMWTQVMTRKIAALELIGRGTRPRVFFSVVASFN
jgi:hemolysin activation/secretion protein